MFPYLKVFLDFIFVQLHGTDNVNSAPLQYLSEDYKHSCILLEHQLAIVKQVCNEIFSSCLIFKKIKPHTRFRC